MSNEKRPSYWRGRRRSDRAKLYLDNLISSLRTPKTNPGHVGLATNFSRGELRGIGTILASISLIDFLLVF
ncbi:MAG: hypothetical protein ACFFFG_18495 [Candidatus Thorarchaeota archaeon]